MRPDAIFLVFWLLGFKPAFALSSFTFIKRLFSCSSFSTISMISSAYLRLLIFLEILIPGKACALSIATFHVKYSAYQLNKQGDTMKPWHTFPILNQSIVPCLVQTVASWPAQRFLRRQARWSGIPISFRIFQFVVIHIVKGFHVVNGAEVYPFFEFPWYFLIQRMLAIWSLAPLSFLNPVCTSGSSWFTCYWSLAWTILSINLLAGEMSIIVQ